MRLDRVEAVLQLLNKQNHIGVVTIEGDGWSLQARRGPYVPPMPAGSAAATSDPARHYVTADRVGIYRAAPQLPRRGELVERGTVLGGIDSMRILNPLAANAEGYLLEMRVEDGEAVEYGQPLFVLSESPLSGDDAG